MIAKVVLLCAAVAAASANTLLGSGIVSPGLLNTGILSPGLLNTGIVAPGLLNSGILTPGLLNTGIYKGSPLLTSGIPITRSVVSAPGLIGSPLVYSNGIISNGLIGASSLGLRSGFIGASPLGLSNGLISPIGLKGAGILTGPGVVKTILK